MTSAVEFEQQLLEAIKTKTDSNVSFEQKADKDLDFGMSMTTPLKSAFSKPMLLMGIGASASAMLAGTFASAIPINLGFFAGAPTLIVGLVGKMLLKDKAPFKDIFNGVVIAGISQAVSRFIPATMPFGQQLSQEVKEKFKQENKPCKSIQEMRSDVAW